MEKKNYKDDFTLLLHLYVKAEDGEYVEIGFPTWDWRAKFYTTNKANAYEASSIGGVMHNCSNVDDKVQVRFDNHRLLAGVLRCEFISLIPSSEYPDGNERVVVVGDLGVTLTKEPIADDDKTISASIVVPFVVGTNIDEALSQLRTDVDNNAQSILTQQAIILQAQDDITALQVATNELAKDLKDATQKVADIAEELSATSELANNNKINITNAQSVANLNTEHLAEVDNRIDALEAQLEHSSIQVVSEYPISGDGMHMVMDEKGLKAVTIWDKEKSYRRFVYNRDPVVYVQASANDQVKINGKMVDLVAGSNYIEVEELTNDCDFYSNTYGSKVTAIIVKCKLPAIVNTGDVWGGSMFYETPAKVIELNIDNSITSLKGLIMFSNNLKHINTGGWDLSNVTDLQYALFMNGGIEEVNVTDWDTSKVSNMSCLFCQSQLLTKFDVSKWDVSKVTNFYKTFLRVGKDNTKYIATIDVSNWDTSSATNMSGMFWDTQRAKLLGIENLKVDKVTNMYDMLGKNQTLVRLDLSAWNPIAVTNTSEMFYECLNLEYLDLSSFDMTKVTNVKEMFFNCTKLTTLKFPQMGKIKLTSFPFYYYNNGLTPKLGTAGEESKQALLDMYSYDRVANGLSTLTTSLHPSSKALLTEEEIAAITAKGYTIA